MDKKQMAKKKQTKAKAKVKSNHILNSIKSNLKKLKNKMVIR